ncbi:hypothetical protein BH10ACI3_BH10ACI3_13190 [soil metagenome]
MNTKKLLIAAAFMFSLAAFSQTSAQSTQIRFAKGRTSATVSSSVPKFGAKSYILGARQGQIMTASISSKGDCVKFENGATSLNQETHNGDNIIGLVNRCGSTISFTLTVSINYGSD